MAVRSRGQEKKGVLAETRDITIALQAAADIRFISLESEKEMYAEGEMVVLKFSIRNIGDTPAEPNILVVDTATGARLVTYSTPILSPNQSFTSSPPHIEVGAMPNSDWVLTVSAYRLVAS